MNKQRNRANGQKQELPPPQPSRDEVARVAYSLYEKNGREEGRALEHWLRAEDELRNIPTSQTLRRAH